MVLHAAAAQGLSPSLPCLACAQPTRTSHAASLAMHIIAEVPARSRRQRHVPILSWKRSAQQGAGVCAAAVAREASLPAQAAVASISPAAGVTAAAAAAEAVAAETAGDAAADYLIVNFYHLCDISDPEQCVARHREAIAGLDIKGRIYISRQGINAQYSGLASHAASYAQWVEGQPEFQGLRWTKVDVGKHMFPRLRLHQRRSLVSLAGGTEELPLTDPSALATPLAPARWREMLQGTVSNPAALQSAVNHPADAEGADASGRIHAGSGTSEAAASLQHREDDSAAACASNSPGAVTGGGAAAAMIGGGVLSPTQPRSSKKAPPDGRSASFDYGYKSRPPICPDGVPVSSGAAAPAWRSLGGRTSPPAPGPAAGSGVSAALGDVVVLDVRNGYEWDAGHFAGAARPSEDAFRETPTDSTRDDIPAALQGRHPETPVMMYCTGGIRCDIYSAYLRKKGFSNLYTLEGGVHAYLEEQGGALWNGSLFVFDGRMAVPPPGKEAGAGLALSAAVACQLCGNAGLLPHRNCANLDCNRLFISCTDCAASLRSCCCEECVRAPRLLRSAKDAGNYGNLASHSIDAEEQASITSGRGEGRRLRRQAWQQRLHVKRAKARATQHGGHRAAVKEKMRAAESGGHESGEP